MKKLMIAACAVACAAVAQAATINWASGTMKLAEDKDGTIGSKTPAKDSGNVAVNSYLWIWAVDKNDAAGLLARETALKDYATFSTAESGIKSVASINQANILKDFVGKEATATVSGNNYTDSAGRTVDNKAAITITGQGSYSNEKVYAIVLTEYYDEALDTTFYQSNALVVNVATSNMPGSNFALKAGGNGTAFTAWQTQSVPEPTSGLLLLLGVAGMALRRRRA